MAFSEEDIIVIRYLRQNQNYSAKRFLMELSVKGWKLSGLNYGTFPVGLIKLVRACVEQVAIDSV